MMRYSPQRATILKVLQGTKTHPTAEWLYDQVQHDIPNISLGTVYRNLNQLADAGAIQRIFDAGFVRYDGNTGRHDHFRCTQCQRIFDLDLPLNDIAESIPEEYGFQVTGYTLEISGVCRECQTTQSMNHEGETEHGT